MPISNNFRTLLPFLLSIITISLWHPLHAQNKDNSILNVGSFHKVSVSKNGVFKMDHAFLNSLPTPGAINPNSVVLYGNRGGMTPELVAADRVDDLEELPLLFVGNSNQVLEENEFFLFYAEGPRLLTYDHQNFELDNNIYEDKNYYFLSTEITRTKNIIEISHQGTAQEQVSTYDEFQKYNNDLVNLLGKNFGTQGTGKVWYGEDFSGDRTQDFVSHFDFEKVSSGTDIQFNSQFALRSDAQTSIRMTINSSSTSTTANKLNLFSQYGTYATVRSLQLAVPFSSTGAIKNVEISMINNSSRFSGWLDFIEVQSINDLKYMGKQFNFRTLSSDAQTLVKYNIATGATLDIWNVSQPFETYSLAQSGGSSPTSFKGNLATEFVAFSRSESFSNPVYLGQVAQQDLHSIHDAEYVILYHGDFEESANRLAVHRRSHDDLITYAVNVNQVFNEFGGGSKDPVAIRDFARMLFKRSATFQYLCLLGDATYDYRGRDSELALDNLIPCYQTDESLSPVFGFPTDDFYALLSDNEGGNLRGALDIAIGRLPVGSVQEANTVVNKLIAYDVDPDFNGDWKNNFILVADDEDTNSHLSETEELGRSITSDRPEFNQRKVYFDAFRQVSTTGDDRYPDAKQKFNDYMFQGSLLVNYFGHGGPNGWAQERVLEIQDILSWTNSKRLPLFITATCTFTGYDDPADKSGGELTLLNPNGGSIGLVSTTRAVTISANERLVESLFEFIYNREDNKPIRMGEVVRLAKNNHRSDTLEKNARKFALIGDPAFRLSFPEHKAVVTSFQGNSVGGQTDTIRALDQVTFSGEIRDSGDDLLPNYNGSLSLTIMDKAQINRTLKNDADSREIEFLAYNSFVFKGNTPIVNGKFSVIFRVPKDIDYKYGFGRISMYASENTNNMEASGYYDDFVIGGTSTSVVDDDSPPTIALFLNNLFFKDGGSTGPDPTLIANLSDNLGLNISNSSIGHEMVAILDEDLPNQIILNDFYQASSISLTDGVIMYPYSNLADGPHTLRVRVWDVANNPAEATLNFVVERGKTDVLENVHVWPNPANEDVVFNFTHELSFTPVNVKIEFYNQLGQPVSELTASVTTGGNAIENVSWNRTGYNGTRLNAGVYYYQISASATSTGGDSESATSPGGKLVLLK